MIPFPGTPAASPATQVIFSSLVPAAIQSVSVRGSRSGQHPGHLVVLPARAGTAFRPDHPFTPGERVSVRAALRSPAAGTASGDPGARVLNFSFTVALSPPPWRSPSAADGGAASRSAAFGPSQRFHSEPGLRPPAMSVSRDPDRSSGDILLTPYHSPQRGPMIVNARGQLVWFLPRLHGVATNLEVQRYRGQPVLTWWEAGPGPGRDVIMNRSYRVVRVLHAGNGYTADPHEFQLTPQGTAFINAVVPVRMDLTSVRGPSNGTVDDAVIQELDIRTGQVLWEWQSLGHVPVSDSYNANPNQSPAYDYFHLNSIQQLPDGNLLVSARNTWAVYEIDRQTGRIIWTLGGKHPTFTAGLGARFEWQHDARLEGSVLTLFDDAALPQEEPQSSGKKLRLSARSRTVTLIKRYTHSPPLISGQEGNMQTLPNGDVFVGWGAQPDFSEYTPNGRQIFNGSFAEGVMSYRAYRFVWNGQPVTRPGMAVEARSRATVMLWASWNGATDVAWWRVLGGSARSRLRPLEVVRQTGFETAITLPAHPRYVALQALDARHRALRTSWPRAVSGTGGRS